MFATWKVGLLNIPCRNTSSPTEAIIHVPLAVEMPLSVSSSFGYIALTDVERCSSGALSALPFSRTMAGARENHGENDGGKMKQRKSGKKK
jgi:hypothetical protein